MFMATCLYLFSHQFALVFHYNILLRTADLWCQLNRSTALNVVIFCKRWTKPDHFLFIFVPFTRQKLFYISIYSDTSCRKKFCSFGPRPQHQNYFFDKSSAAVRSSRATTSSPWSAYVGLRQQRGQVSGQQETKRMNCRHPPKHKFLFTVSFTSAYLLLYLHYISSVHT